MIFEISTLKFVTNDSLTHRVNFSMGFAFSKGPGSAFSEGPGPDSGPLYKVCPSRNIGLPFRQSVFNILYENLI